MATNKVLELLNKYAYEFAEDNIDFNEIRNTYMNDARNYEDIKRDIELQVAKMRLMRSVVNTKVSKEILKSSIILIGPITAGKTTLAKRLSQELGMPRVCLDDKDTLKDFYDLEDMLVDKKDFDFYLVAKVLTSLREPSIIDFGGNHSIYDSPITFTHLKTLVNKFYNVILLLPSPDIDESMQTLNERLEKRDKDMAPKVSKLNKKILTSNCNTELAKNIIYTNHKNISDIAEEAINISIKNISDYKKGAQ